MGVLAKAFDFAVAGTDVLGIIPTFGYTIYAARQKQFRKQAWFAGFRAYQARSDHQGR